MITFKHIAINVVLEATPTVTGEFEVMVWCFYLTGSNPDSFLSHMEPNSPDITVSLWLPGKYKMPKIIRFESLNSPAWAFR